MLIHEVYWLEIHEQRSTELIRAAQQHRLARELRAARRAEEKRERRGGLLPRRALAATGRGLVHVGQWLECAAQQPSY